MRKKGEVGRLEHRPLLLDDGHAVRLLDFRELHVPEGGDPLVFHLLAAAAKVAFSALAEAIGSSTGFAAAKKAWSR